MNSTRMTPGRGGERKAERAHERTEDRCVSSRSGKLLLATRARELLRDAKPHLEGGKNDMEAALRLKDEITDLMLDSSAPCLLGEKASLEGGDEASDLYHALSDCKKRLDRRIMDMKPRC